MTRRRLVLGTLLAALGGVSLGGCGDWPLDPATTEPLAQEARATPPTSVTPHGADMSPEVPATAPDARATAEAPPQPTNVRRSGAAESPTATGSPTPAWSIDVSGWLEQGGVLAVALGPATPGQAPQDTDPPASGAGRTAPLGQSPAAVVSAFGVTTRVARTQAAAGAFRSLALIGIPATLESGQHKVTVTTLLATGAGRRAGVIRQPTTFEIAAGDFSTEVITLTETTRALLEPELREPETVRLAAIWRRVSGPPMWDGPWQPPMDSEITSAYGTRRLYMPGDLPGLHTGLDLRGATGATVVAPAPGRVALARVLDVRGGTVLIDHGLGVYSAFLHLSELAVNENDVIDAGEPVGAVGATGMVTGPHLHWEVRVSGVPVDPMPWTQSDPLAASP